MSVKRCIDSAQRQGEISADQARDLKKRYDRYVATHGAPAAQAKMALELEAEAKQMKRAAYLQERARQRNLADVTQHRDAKGRPNIVRAIQAKIEHYGGYKFSSIEGRRKAILGRAMGSFEQGLHEFRLNVAGVRRNAARLDNVVRELFGHDSGDAAAKGIAKAWSTTAEALRERFNAAGGAVAHLKDWGLPQSHDARKIAKADKEEWRQFIEPLLDPARMRNPLTGDPLTRAELYDTLGVVYTRILSDGWIDREPSQQRFGKGALYKQGQEHRFLVFKDADSWLKYQSRFGRGDPFVAMMGHLAHISREIATMEVFGPNPENMLEYLKQVARQNAMSLVATDVIDADQPASLFPQGVDPKDPSRRPADVMSGVGKRDQVRSYVERELAMIDTMWAHARGNVSTPVSEGVASLFAGARNFITATSMGSAIISAVGTDPMFQGMARRFSGIAGGAGTAFRQTVQHMAGMGERDAVRAGLILEEALHATEEQARFSAAINGPNVMRYLAERTLAISGLNAWTRGARHSFGRAVQGTLMDLLPTSFDALPTPFFRMLERYGFNRAEWEQIQSAVLPRVGRNDHFLTPDLVIKGFAARGEEMAGIRFAERLLEMTLQETEYAVPSGTLRARAVMVGQNRPGTFMGEVLRSVGQFKTFGVTVAMMQGGRIANEIAAGRVARGASYAAGFLVFATLGGALAIQLKQIAGGKDPREMDGDQAVKFWLAAMVQGGGLGIWGDFLLAEQNRFGGGIVSTAAGPLAGRMEAILGLGPGNARELAQGKKTNVGGEITRFAGQNTPILSSLWFMRLAYQRKVIDELQKRIDPEAHQAFRRRIQNTRKDTGQEYFWSPGESSPRRGPAFGGAR